MTDVISNLSNVITANNKLITIGCKKPKIVILSIIDFGNKDIDLLYYNNLLEDNEILMNSCNYGNIDLSFTKIYYVSNSFDKNKLVEMINNDNPNVIAALGKYVLTGLFDLDDTITNKVIYVPMFNTIPVIPSYSPRLVVNNPRLDYVLNRCMKMTYSCMNEIDNAKNKAALSPRYKEEYEKIKPSLNQIEAINNFINNSNDLGDIEALNNKLIELRGNIQNSKSILDSLVAVEINELGDLSKKCSPELELPAESEIIYSYEQFLKFCKQNIETVVKVGYDVETNALPVMDKNHEIIGFSLGNEFFKGCYVPFKSIGFEMPEDDKNKIIDYLKQEIFQKSLDKPEEREVWVYNCQHEVPVVYNHYDMFLENIKDLYVWVKLLNCGMSWESRSRTLKTQVNKMCEYKDWSEDLDTYFKLFRSLNKTEDQLAMKALLSIYYPDLDELNDILNKTIETYNDIKDTLSSTKVISYEYVPTRLIGKYGSLDSSSLFQLKNRYQDDIDYWNKAFDIDLDKGFELWQKIHIAHIIMEMNGLYFNDKKAEKLNIWIDEQSKDIMNQIVSSPLSREWIKNGFYYEFSRNILMMNYVDEILADPDNEGRMLADVVQGRNGITKECIKVHNITKKFIRALNGVNSIIDHYNKLISDTNFSFQDHDAFDERNLLGSRDILIFMNSVSRGKAFSKMNIEYSKGEFVVKINWQNFLVFYKLSRFIDREPDLLDKEFDKWFEEKSKTLNDFADYKELFNVNSTIKSFREYISDILLSKEIKIAHTYYKLYEFTESATYSEDLDSLESKNPRYESVHYNFMLDYEEMMNRTSNEEVFSPKRLNDFIDLFNKYVDDKFINELRYKRKLAPCFDWFLKDGFNSKNLKNDYYKLPTLDASMIEHLTQLYMMLNCNIDDKSTWTDEFRFMFNYKFIKKLIKAKSTYIDGTTGRANAYYVDNRYYLKDKFPRRLDTYKVGNEINNVYDQDKAIEIELENDIKIALPLNEQITLIDGTTKLAKDINPNDDIDISKYINEFELNSDDIDNSDIDED